MTDSQPTTYPGIPDEMLPHWLFWRPEATALRHWSNVSGKALGDFPDEALGLRVDAATGDLVATELCRLTRLRRLVVDGETIPPRLLASIARLTRLEYLDLANVRTPDLDFLGGLLRLEYLFLGGLSGAPSLSPLGRLPRLVSLGIGTDGMSLDDFARGGFAALRCLVLVGRSESRPARFDSLAPLANLGGLEYLVFTHGTARDRALEPLTALPRLKALVLRTIRGWPAADIAKLRSTGVEVHTFP